MSKTLNVTHKLRRNSAATWTSENPVLADGEPGYDTTNNILKIGDGTSDWNSLPSLSGGESSAISYKDTVTAPTDIDPYDTVPTQGSTKPITSGGVYNALIGGWQFQEDRVVSSSVQNVNFTIDLTKYDYRVEMMISAPYNGNFVGSLRNSSGSTYSIPTTWVANTVGNNNTWGTYPAMSTNNEILLADTNTNDTSNTHSIVLEMSMFPSVNRLSYHVDSAIMNGNFHEIKEIYGIMDTSTAPVMLRLRASSSTGVTGEFKIYKRSRS